MTTNSKNFYKIIDIYHQLSYEERISLIKELLNDLKRPEPTTSNNIFDLAGKGEGIYGNIDDYLIQERNWD